MPIFIGLNKLPETWRNPQNDRTADSDSVNLGSNPGPPATQSGLPLAFPQHPGIGAVARYFGGGKRSPLTEVGDSTGFQAPVSVRRF
jgi:hypothetical protein